MGFARYCLRHRARLEHGLEPVLYRCIELGTLGSLHPDEISVLKRIQDDSSSTTWNPVDVTATIEFRGMQATYTFPVGVTTLWWYAAAE